MKILAVVLAAVAAVAAVAVAHPHRHVHHLDRLPPVKREANIADAVVYVPASVETAIVYELNGHQIGEDEVRQGIANGTLTWSDDGTLSSSVAAAAAHPTPAQGQGPKWADGVGPNQDPNENAISAKESPVNPHEPSSQAPQPSPTEYQPIDKDRKCPDCDKEFPNGKFSCDQFPSAYGAVHLPNEGLGGWTGIQDPLDRGSAGFDNIMTVPTGSCPDGTCCSPGRFCSYACPNPYLKLSFPKKQGKTLQSVGGLYCNNEGKLEMADGSLGKTLCGKGSVHMKVKVQNKLSQSVSICRTDYPGTESETIPLTVQPGETGELANPDQSAYYFWNNEPTSAHYYINKKGIPESEACTWGSGGQAVGNWAPLIFGTSFDDRVMNTGFSSLKQNELRWNDRADFTTTFTGDGINSPCKYNHQTQEFCQDNNCGRGVNCTASVKDGSTLILVFADN